MVVLSMLSRLMRGWGSWTTIRESGEEKSGGATIVPPETILEYPDARIFLAVHKMGKHYQAAILEQLRTMGIAEERIVHVDRLIDRLGARAYFDLPWLPHVADEVFVDGGAYDGASSKNFAAWAKSFEHIYAFEPDVANLPLCEETLSEFSKEKTDVFACGLWHEETTLSFDGKASPMSKVDDKGAEHVAVDALDHVLAGKRVTFIKMDIEGAEMEALRGAEQLIRTQHPKLAISVYHKPDDIEEIPAFIHEMYPAYKMYLRHYTLLQYDTVIYCV